MVGRRRYLLPSNFFGCKYDLIQLYRQIDMAACAFRELVLILPTAKQNRPNIEIVGE